METHLIHGSLGDVEIVFTKEKVSQELWEKKEIEIIDSGFIATIRPKEGRPASNDKLESTAGSAVGEAYLRFAFVKFLEDVAWERIDSITDEL